MFSAAGAQYAARAGSNLLLNRATYGYEDPTDVVQRPWADRYLAERTAPHEPRIGLSRMVFPARDKRTALAQIGPGTMAAAAKFVARGQFPAGLDVESYLRRFHSFYGHPDEIIGQLQAERVCRWPPTCSASSTRGSWTRTRRSRPLELIATEIAPALGWRPGTSRPARSPGQCGRPARSRSPGTRWRRADEDREQTMTVSTTIRYDGPADLRTRGRILVVPGRGESQVTYVPAGHPAGSRFLSRPGPAAAGDRPGRRGRRAGAFGPGRAPGGRGRPDAGDRPLILIGADTGALAIAAVLARGALDQGTLDWGTLTGRPPQPDAVVLAGLPGRGRRHSSDWPRTGRPDPVLGPRSCSAATRRCSGAAWPPRCPMS